MVITIDKCYTCGYILNTIKTGDVLSKKGKKTTLNVKCAADMQREVIKSITCTVTVPELDLELTAGTLGTQFTSIENILKMAQQDLLKHVYSIATSTGDDQSNLGAFLVKMDLVVKGEQDFTFIIDDALDNSV